MGLGLYPVFDPRLTGSPVFLGEMLGDVYAKLDRIADRRGLPRLTSFADARVVPPNFRGHPDELDAVIGPRSDWHRPEDGIAVATALADLVASDRRLAKRFDYPEAVVSELRELAALLALGRDQGASFRLALS
jgi:hypothetical protein